MARICLIGGSGFLGSHVARQLVSRQHHLIMPTRNRERAKRDLIMLPTVDMIPANVDDDRTLDRLLTGCDAVINMVGVLHSPSGHPYGPSFARAHVELPRRVVAACLRRGVKRLLHVSALNASDSAPSEYLRSKAAGEAEILAARDALNVTIFRPSVIFGPGDSFLNTFASLQRYFLFLPLAMPQARFQPVFVDDVAAAMLASLDEDHSYGQIYELVGPRVYTLRELVSYAGSLIGHERPIFGLGHGLSMLQAGVLECLPMKVMSRDNVRSMTIDNVSQAPFPFGITPSPLEGVAPEYLSAEPHSRYDRLRQFAARR